MTKKITLALLCLIFTGATFAQQKRTCYAMDDLAERQIKDPTLKKRMTTIEQFTQKSLKRMQNQQSKQVGEIITLPVVVHILYTNATNNISTAQIESQLAVLNADFRRTNADRTNKWAQAADSQIEFKLATIDPNGNATTGITRTQVSKSTWLTGNNAMKKLSEGGVNPWDTSEYLNMWIVDNITRPTGGTILGYAQFPGGSAATDGVVMADEYFGTIGTAKAPFDGGRTTTHEVGHFLNLRHIWGDGPCGSDDFVSDTPESDAANYGCKSAHTSCGSLDMVENYMDYSDDSCMNLFTSGQKDRMRTVLGVGGSRHALATSDKFGEVVVVPVSYCVSKGKNITDESIQKVTLGAINNTSTLDTGYTDYTSISTDLTKGESNIITITPKWSGTVYKEGYGVWIDYNKDGDFDDAGENVFTKAPSKETTVTGTFTAPLSAINGATRMRVVLKYNKTPKACETSIEYGEVEDYTVVIGEGNADTTAPTVPANLAVSNVDKTSVTLNWSAATDNVAVTGYNVYQGATKLGTTTNISTDITGLSPATSYTFSVKAIDAVENESEASNVINVTTLANQLVYCESKGTNSSYEWIDAVSLGGMANTSASNGGYADFTSKIATLGQGSSNEITLSAGFKNTAYTEHWAVWIDFNQNGIFDTSEKVVKGSSSSDKYLTSTFEVPASALLGQTRMRVSMKYNSSQTACETFKDGEVEDYTVNITATTTKEALLSGNRLVNEPSTALQVYPNPAVNFIHVNLASKAKNISYKIINITGSIVQKGRLNNTKLNVTNLSSGMYILEVYDGQKVLTTKLLKK
ncbi:GEVED domain-containing protein [Tenacibaculum dicentrarchi]|nr:GEVED domain-containing protein [Tenacibaculum dicentrarchi]MCD8419510.1 GEVED domain-containing protein [Tenacibaculum dicentrarchi]MCD8436155.1 GEVED domain-containing protein [Tenacibaculum dicentrarchi]MCD8451319.1 GEVED domain-containing protein [Tenacibaculum dicentrarchi]MCG8827425.1 T9SS type A sorting domain-containing protein [Tenacibaculum dicentrarchi]